MELRPIGVGWFFDSILRENLSPKHYKIIPYEQDRDI